MECAEHQNYGSVEEFGLASGGLIEQEIIKDPYGIETWDQDNYCRVSVHLISTDMYHEVTGADVLPGDIDKGYKGNRLP